MIVEILRESEKCVWWRSSWGADVRALKSSGGTIYHDTWKEARAHVVEQADWRFKSAQRKLEIVRQELVDAISLPDDEPEADG